jgi:DNA-binding IclR family transcriptional regulator
MSKTPAAAPASTRTGTAALKKTIELLRLIGHGEKDISFSLLMKESGLPKATLTRVLRFLREEGLVRVDAAGKYHVGYEIISLAHKALSDLDVRAIAVEEMQRLRELTSETIHLSLLSETSVIFVEKIESAQPVRMYSSIGRQCPIYCTGSGKAILAYIERDKRKAIIATTERVRYTPSTIIGGVALEKELAAIRARGFAIDDEEHEPGIRCVAAPIFDKSGAVIAALSVTNPAYRCTIETLHSYAPALVAATARISRRLGHIP